MIEIGRRHYLLYLLLPHALKMSLLSEASRAKLDRINRAFNESMYSGAAATGYDEIHGYGDADRHDYPARKLIESIWAPDGYGTALELGAGSGYFTVPLARRARSVIAVEPVPDLGKVIRQRCEAEGIGNVRVLGGTAFELERHVAAASIDSAVVVQSLHHVHRRPEVFRTLGRLVRPGGRLYLVEPHHNVKRVGRLVRSYVTTYRFASFWTREENWATHDFLTRGELRQLCAEGGFAVRRIEGYWIPYSRRLVPDGERRLDLERAAGRFPIIRHLAAVLAIEAQRTDRPIGPEPGTV